MNNALKKWLKKLIKLNLDDNGAPIFYKTHVNGKLKYVLVGISSYLADQDGCRVFNKPR